LPSQSAGPIRPEVFSLLLDLRSRFEDDCPKEPPVGKRRFDEPPLAKLDKELVRELMKPLLSLGPWVPWYAISSLGGVAEDGVEGDGEMGSPGEFIVEHDGRGTGSRFEGRDRGFYDATRACHAPARRVHLR
jgi:hypothetical protein